MKEEKLSSLSSISSPHSSPPPNKKRVISLLEDDEKENIDPENSESDSSVLLISRSKSGLHEKIILLKIFMITMIEIRNTTEKKTCVITKK